MRCFSTVFKTIYTVAHQAPLSMGLSRQEYQRGLPLLSQGIFTTQESNLCLLRHLLAGIFFTTEPPVKPLYLCWFFFLRNHKAALVQLECAHNSRFWLSNSGRPEALHFLQAPGQCLSCWSEDHTLSSRVADDVKPGWVNRNKFCG